MPNIVVLDAATLGNDIDFLPITSLGDTTFYQTTSPTETANRIRNAEIIITNKVFIGKNEIANAPNLRLVCVAATGYNNVDLPVLTAHGIAVTNVKGYSTQTVAQLVFASLLNIYGSTSIYNSDMRKNLWQQSPIFTMLTHPINDLENKTIGIIGYGSIGKQVEYLAKAFGMIPLICALPNRSYANNENRISFNALLQQSDIVTLHCPLTPQTENLISMSQLQMMKSSAILVNTSRGSVVNIDDLTKALENKIIRAAVIDVMPNEPPKNHSIFSCPNAYITPHIAWASIEARTRLVAKIAYNIKVYLEGNIDSIKL